MTPHCCWPLVFGVFGYLVSAHSWEGKHITNHGRTCPAEDPLTHECYDLRSENTTCVSFKMECEDFDNGTCVLRYKMTSIPCQMFKCISLGCCDGFTRNDHHICEVSVHPALNCLNDGAVSDVDPDRCVCEPHFTGQRCEYAMCNGGCLNGGRCEIVHGEPVCICPSMAYSGNQCEYLKCANKCLNGGECITDGVYTRCNCTGNYVGPQCQYENREACPTVNSNHMECTDTEKEKCHDDQDCKGDSICCFDGCEQVCLKPVQVKCDNNDGNVYRPGDAYKPEICTKCTCQVDGKFHCINITCSNTKCPDDKSPIYWSGHCCKICPSDEIDDVVERPEFENCPKAPIFAPIDKTGIVATLPKLDLVAKDHNGQILSVNYSRTSFVHSLSADIEKNLHHVIAYSDCDMYGRRAECVFRVLVEDPYPPQFTSCPIEIYTLIDEVITWQDPAAKDNVGIYRMKTEGDEVRGKKLRVGIYTVSFTVWDYDLNPAICTFVIRVFDEGFGAEINPLRRKHIPAATIIGCSIAVIIFVSVFVCAYIQIRHRNRDSQSAAQTEQNINNIFMMTGNINHAYANDVKLPAYSPPMNPPPYDEVAMHSTSFDVTNPEEPPIYEEIPARNGMDSPKYENIRPGFGNPIYMNDNVNNNMDYLKE